MSTRENNYRAKMSLENYDSQNLSYEKQSKENWFFKKYTLVVTILACIASNIGISALSWVMVGALAILIFKPFNLIGPLFLFTACDDFLLVAEGVTFSRFCVLFFIVGVLLDMLLKNSVIKRATFFPVILTFLGIFLSFYSIFDYTEFPIAYILNMALFIAMINYTPRSSCDITEQLCRYSIVAGIYATFIFFSRGLDSLIDGTRLTLADTANSNEVARGLSIVFIVLLCNLFLFRKNKLINIALMLVSVGIVFLTGSRSAFIAIVATSLILFMMFTTDKKTRKKAFFISAICVVALIGVYIYLQNNFPLLMERFTLDEISETGGTGRVDIWRAFFKDYFPNHFLIGIGFDPYNMFHAAYLSNGEGHGAHNILVETLSRTGVLGLALFGAYFISYFKRATKKVHTNKYIIYSLAIVMLVMISGIGENGLTARFLWYGIGLLYMFYNAEKIASSKPEGENNA